MIPNRDNPSDVIKIIGPREGIEKAVHQIQLISDEQVCLRFIARVISEVRMPNSI